MLPPSDEPAPLERGMPDTLFQCAHYTTFFLLCKGKIPRAALNRARFCPVFFSPEGKCRAAAVSSANPPPCIDNAAGKQVQ